jgi:hypothetical protein
MKQDIFVEIIKNNTEAMNRVANAFDAMNDQNALHYAKDDSREDTIRKNTVVTETVVKTFYTIMILLVGAMVVLAGAEKVFQFIKL